MPNGEVRIEVVRDPNAEHLRAVARLLPQLSSSTPPDLEALRALAERPTAALLFARRSGEIVGTLTLETFSLLSGVRAWIEDVIVDEAARGAGIGRALVEYALEVARGLGAKTVDLTSRPSREAANALYQRVGFVRRDTNVYRIELRGPQDSTAHL